MSGLAEQVGFEPTRDSRRLSVFKTVPFNRLGTVPFCAHRAVSSLRTALPVLSGPSANLLKEVSSGATLTPVEEAAGIEPTISALCCADECHTPRFQISATQPGGGILFYSQTRWNSRLLLGPGWIAISSLVTRFKRTIDESFFILTMTLSESIPFARRNSHSSFVGVRNLVAPISVTDY